MSPTPHGEFVATFNRSYRDQVGEGTSCPLTYLEIYAFKICNWKMENGKQCVHMNHFTLGRETAACEKKPTPTPLFQDISL